MRPIGFRRFVAGGFAAAVLFVAPGAKASSVTVDVGVVAYTLGINASISYLGAPSDTETYTFQQLLFTPDPSLSGLTFDNGQTLEQVLAQDLGNQNYGTLDYNFPFDAGASGSYTLNGTPSFPLPLEPGDLSLTATSQSGTVYEGYNNVGATISVDPTDAATTYETILGGQSFDLDSESPTPTTTTVMLPLGTITVDGVVTTYIGEVTDSEWTVSAGPAVAETPEPSSLWLVAAGFATLYAVRRRLCKAMPGLRA